MRVFVAGATGVIGQRLVPRLVAVGHQVVATTRSPAKADSLRALGAEPAVVDGLDAMAVGEAVGRAGPEVVIHQMTQLAGITSLRRFDRVFEVTNRLRTQGTDHLLAAATAAGERRFIAQGYAGWPSNRAGGPVQTEADPLDADPPAAQRQSLGALRQLEAAVTGASSLEGIVLRYGSFYGPGASEEIFGLVRKRKLPIAGNAARSPVASCRPSAPSSTRTSCITWGRSRTSAAASATGPPAVRDSRTSRRLTRVH